VNEVHKLLAFSDTESKEFHDGDWYSLWKDDALAAEWEVCDLLYGFIRVLKPSLVFESGTGIGHTTKALILGCVANLKGRVVSCETDRDKVEQAQKFLGEFPNVEILNIPAATSYDLKQADFIFSDSSYESRVEEWDVVKPGALFVVHDICASPALARFVNEHRGLSLAKGRGVGILLKE